VVADHLSRVERLLSGGAIVMLGGMLMPFISRNPRDDTESFAAHEESGEGKP